MVNLVVALHHFQHITPPIREIFQLVPLDVCLERILQKQTMIKLNIKENRLISHVTKAKGYYRVLVGKRRILLVFSIRRSSIFMNRLMLNNMKIKL